MMGDLKKRASFARVVNYVNNPKKARIIDCKDVRLDDNATIARSMQGQANDKPGRKLKNPVYHISLDFAHLLDYIKPDVVHVLYKGRIVKTAGPELALELEEKGYDWIKKELGE